MGFGCGFGSREPASGFKGESGKDHNLSLKNDRYGANSKISEFWSDKFGIHSSETEPPGTSQSSKKLSATVPLESKSSDIERDKNGEDQQTGTQEEHNIPNGGYGWLVVLCVFIINAHTWGLNSSYAVFLDHYIKTNRFPSSNPRILGLVGGVSIGLACFINPFATMMMRRIGMRVTLTVGLLLQSSAMFLASFVQHDKSWQLFLSQGACYGIGMGTMLVAYLGVIAHWFTTRSALAHGIATGGSGLGGLMFSLVTSKVLTKMGFKSWLRLLGVWSIVVNGTCAIFLRDRRHASTEMHPFDVRLLKNPEYVLYILYGWVSILGYVVLLFSLPHFATSIGMTGSKGPLLAALLNVGQMFGRPIVGLLANIIGQINMSVVVSLLAGILCLAVWMPARSIGLYVFFSVAAGCVAGSMWVLLAPIGSEIVGLPRLQSGLSIFMVCVSVPAILAEPVALTLANAYKGSYRGVQILVGVLYLSAALIMLIIRVHLIERKLRENKLTEGEKEESRLDTRIHKSPDSIPGSEKLSSRAIRWVHLLFKWEKV